METPKKTPLHPTEAVHDVLESMADELKFMQKVHTDIAEGSDYPSTRAYSDGVVYGVSYALHLINEWANAL
jgi:hypothetical protein